MAVSSPKMSKIDVPFSIKALDGQKGVFEGYAATYDLDLVNDRIQPGAFDQTISMAKAMQRAKGNEFSHVLLYQHQYDKVIGGITEIFEDGRKGLRIKGILDLDTELGRNAYSGMSKGYLRSLSIGYKVRKDHVERGGVRVLEAVDLVEISLVTFPANPEARISDIKSGEWKAELVKDMKRTAQRLVNAQKRSNGVTTDFNEAAFGGRTDRSSYREPVPVPDDFEDPGAFVASLRKQLEKEDFVYTLHGRAYENELALRKQQREKKRLEQQAALERERAETAERQRLMSAPTFTPKSYAKATGIDEPWLRVRFQRWVTGGLVTAIDERTLELDASEVKRMTRREHGQFEAKFVELAAKRERGVR